MDRERLYLYFFLTLVLVFIGAAFLMLLPFIVPLLWAMVIGTVLYPVHAYLEKALKNSTLSALLMTVLVFLFMVVPFSLISVLTLQQLVSVTQSLMTYFQEHSYEDLLAYLRSVPFLSEYAHLVESEEIRKLIGDLANALLRFVGDLLGEIAFLVSRNAFYTFVFLLTFFFILKEGPGILHRVRRLVPMEEKDLEEVMGTVYRTVLAVVYGSVGTALVQAIVGFVGYSIVGLKFSLLWGVLTFFAAFIPPFGASAVWFPLAVFSFMSLGTWQAIFLALWGTLLISTMDNFIRPLIIKRGVDMPYVVLFFATIGGLLKFGFIGLFLGPIIFTTLFALFEIYERKVIGDT